MKIKGIPRHIIFVDGIPVKFNEKGEANTSIKIASKIGKMKRKKKRGRK